MKGPRVGITSRGSVQVFTHTLPDTMVPAFEGFGVTLVRATLSDLKALASFAYGSIHTTGASAKKHPDIVRKVAGAVRRATEFITSHSPDKLFPSLRKRFKKTSPKVLKLSLRRAIKATSPDGKVSLQAVRNAEKFLLKGKKIKRSLSDHELKQVYTNEVL